MLKYNSFLEDLILESIINESILYFSPDFRNILSKMRYNDIGSNLIHAETHNFEPDITFIEVDPEDGYLSFNTMKNGRKLISARYGEQSLFDKPDRDTLDQIWRNDNAQGEKGSGVWSKSRNQIKIGKFINKLFPEKYTDKQIEEFVNEFKALLDKKSEKFEIVSGSVIDSCYDYHNYKEKSGTLGASCMATKSGSGIFFIYINNPEVCRLLLLKEENKIIGRALVWKLTSIKIEGTEEKLNAEYFMDRQYTMKDSDVNKFKNYAKSQKWAYKAHNNHQSQESIIFNDKEVRVEMTVQVKPIKPDVFEYKYYPYLDTFRRYDPKIGIFYNDALKSGNKVKDGQYLLDQTNGARTIIDTRVYCGCYDIKLPQDQAVYSSRIDDWIPRDKVIEVKMGRREGLYPQNYKKLVFDKQLDQHLHIDDAAYSETDKEWIYNRNIVKAIISIDENFRCFMDIFRKKSENIIPITEKSGIVLTTWYSVMSRKSNITDSNYIHTSILTKNKDGVWIPKIFELIIYKIEPAKDSKKTPIEIKATHLDKIDAMALGYDIIENDSIITDKFSYSVIISEFKEQLMERIKAKIKSIKKNYTSITDKLDKEKIKKTVTPEDEESSSKAEDKKRSTSEWVKRKRDMGWSSYPDPDDLFGPSNGNEWWGPKESADVGNIWSGIDFFDDLPKNSSKPKEEEYTEEGKELKNKLNTLDDQLKSLEKRLGELNNGKWEIEKPGEINVDKKRKLDSFKRFMIVHHPEMIKKGYTDEQWIELMNLMDRKKKSTNRGPFSPLF